MKTSNAFNDAADAMGAGIDALFTDQDTQYSMVDIDMIEVGAQIRETFEDEENTLKDLADSIKKSGGILQPILLRTYGAGYKLVAGERRLRATRLAGFHQIPAVIREMTDEEAEDAQLAENIHRLNLSQIEEAKKIQRDLDALGSVEAVLAKHQKSRPWLSKILSLLNLPEQAKRLVVENVSADVEIINNVRTIEKKDPVRAKKLVDDLKASRGKENARDKVKKVKDEVKPGKSNVTELKQSEIFASAKPENKSASKSPRPVVFSTAEALNSIYVGVFESGAKPSSILGGMSKEDKGTIESYLRGFFDSGRRTKDIGRAVIQGIREGKFSTDGDGAFALVAFLNGIDTLAQFNLLKILASVKE